MNMYDEYRSTLICFQTIKLLESARITTIMNMYNEYRSTLICFQTTIKLLEYPQPTPTNEFPQKTEVTSQEILPQKGLACNKMVLLV